MPPSVIKVYKNKGQTPLECIDELKKSHTEWASIPMTYAGRLDPLASGVLLILCGDECIKREEYTSLSKEYELTILFGFATDTYDVLGRVMESGQQESFPPLLRGGAIGGGVNTPSVYDYSPLAGGEELKNTLQSFIGTITQSYPPYSSRTVAGKPLWEWAREGKLDEITIPTHEVLIEKIEIIKHDVMPVANLREKIHSDIALVDGDFRQDEILAQWDKVLANSSQTQYETTTLRVSCGSGAYMRTLAYDIGKELGIPSLALNIVRTKVGEYTLEH